MQVDLSKYTVQIKDAITWGMQEQIRGAMLEGVSMSGTPTEKDLMNMKLGPEAMSASKYKAIELCVEKITDAEGKDIPYSKEWMDNLSIQDGDALYAAINKVTSPKE